MNQAHLNLSKISQMNLGILSEKALASNLYTSKEDADKALEEYSKYMALCLANPGEKIAMSKFVDGIWHTHLEDGHSYAKMCVNVGGFYVRHVPKIEHGQSIHEAESIKSFARLYSESFGEADPKLWEMSACECFCESEGVEIRKFH